jgi:glycosyltransferase involved in cell wall biosynthesis
MLEPLEMSDVSRAESPLVLIPAYNAGPSVGEVVAQVRALGLPVVVVDDGSSDDTGVRATQAGATVLRHPQNRGKGSAIQTGFAYAVRCGTSALITMDADGQHDAAELHNLLAAQAQHPDSLIVGVRSFDPQVMPRRSRIGNRISTYWISLFARRLHHDTQSGFRIYPRRLFALPLKTRRFDTETEILLWAAKLGVPLIEVPIATIYHGGHRSHFRNWEDTLRVIRLVITSPLWRVDPESGAMPHGMTEAL